MASAVHFCFVIFIFTEISVSSVYADYNKYVSLISDVHRKFSTSSVFVTFSYDNSSMNVFTTVHSLSRKLSRDGILTLTVHMDDLKKRLEYYRKRTGRPLVVIWLKSGDDIYNFNRGHYRMSKTNAIWLVIFYGHPNNRFCEYCRHPKGNKFRLQFNTFMLVLCCDNSTLQEWWSGRLKRTKTSDFGTWTANQRFKLLSTKGLNARRNNLHRKRLRVILINGNKQGFDGLLLLELQRAMNFTISQWLKAEELGIYNKTTKRWSGAIGLLTEGRADLVVIGLHMTLSKPDNIDVAQAPAPLHWKLIVRRPDRSVGHKFAYFEVFAPEIWVIIIGLLFTTPLLLAFMEDQNCSESWLALYLQNYSRVWGILCQQGLQEFPAETPMRIAYISIFISGIGVYATYTALLTTFLTIFKLPFSDLTTFLEDGSYELVIDRHSANYGFLKASISPIHKKMMMLMKPFERLPSNREKAWEQVCGERVAYLAVVSDNELGDVECDVVGIETGALTSYGLALEADSPWTKAVNYNLQRFSANGMFHRILTMSHTRTKSVKTLSNGTEISGITPILNLLAGGIILALTVLFFEIIYYSFNNRKRCRAVGAR